jgi:hypothetical protein
VVNVYYSTVTQFWIMSTTVKPELGGVMGLDAGAVLKRSLLCPLCHEDYYFTLRGIADSPE